MKTAAIRVAVVLLPFLLSGCGSGAGDAAAPPSPVTTAVTVVPSTLPTSTLPTSALATSTSTTSEPAGQPAAGDSATLVTPVTEDEWRAQAATWLAVHGSDLTDVSGAAKTFGSALQARDVKMTVTAINSFLSKVAKTDGDLPANAFGHDLHEVMNDYIGALSILRQGVVGNDQHSLVAGSNALSVAVAKFGVISARVQATS